MIICINDSIRVYINSIYLFTKYNYIIIQLFNYTFPYLLLTNLF